MDLQLKFAHNPTVMARVIGNETVMLHLNSGTYFGLDPIGTQIWEMIEEGAPLTTICDALVAEYHQPRVKIEGDVQLLVQELIDNKLIEPASP